MKEAAAQNLQLPPEQMIRGAGRLGSAGCGKAGWYDRPWTPVRAGRGLHLAGETKRLAHGQVCRIAGKDESGSSHLIHHR